MQLNTSKQINAIRKNIKKWDQIRNTELGLTFLTSGFGLEINKEEYNEWEKKSPKNIHLYIGILEFETVFYLVDSVTDEKEEYIIGKNLFIKNFTKENAKSLLKNDLTKKTHELKIDDTEAAKRAFKWFFFSNEWAHRKIKEMSKPTKGKVLPGIVRVFTIPFNDLKNIFTDTESAKTLLFFGLKNMSVSRQEEETEEIEVLLCSEKGFEIKSKNLNESEDFTTPRPPYSIDDQNLNLL